MTIQRVICYPSEGARASSRQRATTDTHHGQHSLAKYQGTIKDIGGIPNVARGPVTRAFVIISQQYLQSSPPVTEVRSADYESSHFDQPAGKHSESVDKRIASMRECG